MKTIYKLYILIIFFTISACTKENSTSTDAPPNVDGSVALKGITISTIDVTNIKTIIATANCNVVVDPAQNNISNKGLVWSTAQNPTIALTTKTSEGTATGNYQSQITNLQSNTKYFVRSYAVDASGNVAYGNEISFTTKVGFKSVVCGGRYSLAIKDDGTLWAWGNNQFGQLGNGTSINQNSPVQIGTDQDWKTIVTGGENTNFGFSTFGIKNNGTLWAWGYNNIGQLGDGTNVSKFIPTQIGNDTWISISTSLQTCSFGVKSDGSVWAWGGVIINYSGYTSSVPIRVNGIANCKSVYNEPNYALFIKTDNTLWGYGNGPGLVPDSNNLFPMQQIGSANNWSNLYGNAGTCLATKTDGTAWGCGSNGFGVFGTGSNAGYSTFTQISSNLGANSLNISFGAMTYYVKLDGTLWGTGYGVLGDGTPTGFRYIFTKVGSLSTWKYVSAAKQYLCNFAIQTNGSLWVCAPDNTDGQLGIGDNNPNTAKLSFTLVE